MRKIEKTAWPGTLALLFAVSVLVRFLFANHLRVMAVYPDELRYFMLAESLATGRGLAIYNSAISFQKILYTLMLVPAFLAKGRTVTLCLIALINAVLLSLGIFPVFWLGRRVTDSRPAALFCAVLYILSADMAYSMMFVSEVLYIPLALCLLCLFYRYWTADGALGPAWHARNGFVLGLGIWLTYFCKEVALSFLVSHFLILLFDIVRQKSASLRTARLLSALCCLAGFLLPFLLLKLTLFRGLGNSYHQQSVDVLFLDGRPLYLLYSFFYYLLNTALAFGVFPLLLPILFYKLMPEKCRTFFAFCVTLLAVVALVVAYTISVREDYPGIVPRAHVRYISFLCVPLWMLVFPSLRKADPCRYRRRVCAVGACFCLPYLFYRGPTDGSGIDETHLRYIIDGLPEKLVPFIPVLVIVTIAAALAILVRNKRLFLSLLVSLFSVLQLINNVGVIHLYFQTFGISEAAFAQTLALRDFVDEHAGETFVSVFVTNLQLGQKAIDTFVNQPNVLTVSLYDLADIPGSGDIDLAEQPLPDAYEHHVYAQQTVEYLILPADLQPDGAGAEPVTDYDLLGLSLYRLADTGRFPRLTS